MNFRKWADDMSTGETACGSKEFDPPFPFPPGGSRGGDGSPHAAAAPPARGVSRRSAEPPLARSPRIGLSRIYSIQLLRAERR